MHRNDLSLHKVGWIVFKGAELEAPQRRRSNRNRIDLARRGCRFDRFGIAVSIDARQRESIDRAVGQTFDQFRGLRRSCLHTFHRLATGRHVDPIGIFQLRVGSRPRKEGPLVSGHGLEIRGRHAGRLGGADGRHLHGQPVGVTRLHGKGIGAIVYQPLDGQLTGVGRNVFGSSRNLRIIGRPTDVILHGGGLPLLRGPFNRRLTVTGRCLYRLDLEEREGGLRQIVIAAARTQRGNGCQQSEKSIFFMVVCRFEINNRDSATAAACC